MGSIPLYCAMNTLIILLSLIFRMKYEANVSLTFHTVKWNLLHAVCILLPLSTQLPYLHTQHVQVSTPFSPLHGSLPARHQSPARNSEPKKPEKGTE